jgi:hypothetical protein
MLCASHGRSSSAIFSAANSIAIACPTKNLALSSKSDIPTVAPPLVVRQHKCSVVIVSG